MYEILAAIITGVATVLAALMATQEGRETLFVKAKIGGPDSGPTSRSSIVSRRAIWIFLIGAIAGLFFFRLAAEAAERISFVNGYKTPVGTVAAYMGKTQPDGWLFCDGTKIKEEYKDLRNMVGDLTPNMQGCFLRGLDPAGTNDPDGRNRALGSFQADEFKKHHHGALRAKGGDGGHPGQGDGLYAGDMFQTGDTGGAETRPKNIAVNYIIKY